MVDNPLHRYSGTLQSQYSHNTVQGRSNDVQEMDSS